MESTKLLYHSPNPILDWRTNALRSLAALALGNARLTNVPKQIVLPIEMVQLCATLWQNTIQSNHEWGALLLTANEADMFYCLQRGAEHEMVWNTKDVDGGMVIVMDVHTHPNRTWPSATDFNELFRCSHVAEVVVAGEAESFLLLKDDRSAEPKCWMYHSSNNRDYHLVSPEEVEKVYG